MKSSGIGGQAVIEGVMMKNGGKYAVAVRKPDGEITVDVKNTKDPKERKGILKLPIIRGVVSFIDSLTLGMSTLTYSTEMYGEEEQSAFEQKINKLTKGNADKIFNGITIIFSVMLALVIFVLVPMVLSSLISGFIVNDMLVALAEGVIRVVIFILYIMLISQMDDIRRMFMYHGAEHKCINCIESGHSLTVENVRRASKEHKRCGTSFMLNVMVLSIIFFMIIRVDNVFLKLGLRIVLIPLIAGISYEFIRLAGSHDNKFINFLSKPGLLMQALTTKEPDDKMIEVGIASVEAVFDWKPFVEGIKEAERSSRKIKKNADETSQTVQAPVSEESFRPLEIDISELFDIKLPENETAPKRFLKKNQVETKAVRQPEKEEDDLLSALDIMFEYSGPVTVMEMPNSEELKATEGITKFVQKTAYESDNSQTHDFVLGENASVVHPIHDYTQGVGPESLDLYLSSTPLYVEETDIKENTQELHSEYSEETYFLEAKKPKAVQRDGYDTVKVPADLKRRGKNKR